jgi:putative mRNA 3-end processing factor
MTKVSGNNIEVKILGSGKEVGRAAIAVGRNGKYVLLDYGVNFDEKDNPVMPLPIAPKDVEALVLTHTHLDHIGAAPLLYVSKNIRAFATELTRDAARLMLEDFLKLSGYYLDFEIEEVNKLIDNIQPVEHGQTVSAGQFLLSFFDSGHIQGSIGTIVDVDSTRILYTSDVNLMETKLVGPAKIDGLKADIVIIESTYGSTDHPPRIDVEKRFIDAVREVIENNGVVLVPSFSIGRGQEILSILIDNDIYPVRVDGMIRRASEISLMHRKFLRRPELLEKAMEEYLFVRGWQDRRKAWKTPGVIVASAGMLKGGPSRYYLRKIGKEKRNAVFLVSYQAEGTPGREILEKGGTSEIPKLESRVEWFDFSSHADSTSLINILKRISSVQTVILVHGEEEIQRVFADKVEKELGIKPIIPSTGDTIIL